MTAINIKHAALLFAMQDEALPLIRRLELIDKGFLSPPMPMRWYDGEVDGLRVDVVVMGSDRRFGVDCIGTQPAAVAAQLVLDKLDPGLLINAGTCGGFIRRGGAIGKVYLTGGPFYFHDRRIPLAPFELYADGGWELCGVSEWAEALGLEQGVVSSGNSLDMNGDDAARIERVGTHAKDMEAAAIAWVADQHQKPLCAVKAVTDLVDGPHPTHEEFERHLHTASDALSEALEKLLHLLSKPSPENQP
ncbi:MAG: 5'-methylthioadenosine nucleosidase [Planctomycetota bacterium]